MKSIALRQGLSLFLSVAACAGPGCSSSPSAGGGGDAGGTGSGGTVGSGGVHGSGGTAETGGATGSGGSLASGGAPSLGGTNGSGGVAGSRGAAGQGGAPQGSGGVGATGGSTSTNGGATGTGGTSAGGGATGTGGTSAGGGTSGAAVSIFDGKTLNGWSLADNAPPNAFSVDVADGAIASTGGVRATLYYSQERLSFYRVIYSVRQIVRKNHDPGVLFFGPDPTKDALWGVMFALPDNWGWDYRNGVSNGTGKGVGVVPNVDLTQWARCELLVNSATGTAKAACAQPVGTKAVEVLTFTEAKNPNVPSYFGILCHTAGEVDEYKDITLEVNPAVNDLITTK
jgi:hypothetical protein